MKWVQAQNRSMSTMSLMILSSCVTLAAVERMSLAPKHQTPRCRELVYAEVAVCYALLTTAVCTMAIIAPGADNGLHHLLILAH